MRLAWADQLSRPTPSKRAAERIQVMLPARLTWKDQRGSTRCVSVVTRDVSEFGAFVECTSPVSIPLYRLVQFQLERDVRDAEGLPSTLRQGRLLAAVYRVRKPVRPGGRQGIALRLLVDPKRRVTASPVAMRPSAAPAIPDVVAVAVAHEVGLTTAWPNLP